VAHRNVIPTRATGVLMIDSNQLSLTPQPPEAGASEQVPLGAPTPGSGSSGDQLPPSHCPYRQATLLQQALAPNKMRVAFLLGAGCPLSIRVPTEAGTAPLIPDIAGLTTMVRGTLDADLKMKATAAALLARLKEQGKATPTIEDILSHVIALRDVIGTNDLSGLTAKTLLALNDAIATRTLEVMNVRLPSLTSPYHKLAAWISGISRVHPVEVFTTNYDLLMEQALEECMVPYFDGFVGADRPFFDVPSMEQDTLPARWARLWKVHGSVNWWTTSNASVRRGADLKNGERVLIYASHLKYQQSRRMPYLAMMDRMRRFFTQGQSVLITCGYSFADHHVNDVILQGLSARPDAICFGLVFGDLASHQEALERAKRHANFNLLGADGAVLGTVERHWRSDEKLDHPLHGLAVRTGLFGGRSQAPAARCKYLLGDFATLGDFLARQLAPRDDDGESTNGG
jgi:hypothetical protein